MLLTHTGCSSTSHSSPVKYSVNDVAAVVEAKPYETVEAPNNCMLHTTQHRPGQQRLCAPIAHANVPRPVRHNVAVGQQGTRPSTRHQVLVRVVQEPDIKQSNAEAFIESVKESLKEQSKDEEDTIIAASIDDLQQQVSGIEQQVRALTRH